MRSVLAVASALIFVACKAPVGGLGVGGASSSVCRSSSSRLAALAWMAGCWSMRRGTALVQECWLCPRGGLMLGVNRDTKARRRTFFEYLRIEDRRGKLVYLASPLGREPTPFPAVRVGKRRVVFANPRHDFPQRITYWLAADGTLHARVEGRSRGKPRSFELVWRRRPAGW